MRNSLKDFIRDNTIYSYKWITYNSGNTVTYEKDFINPGSYDLKIIEVTQYNNVPNNIIINVCF